MMKVVICRSRFECEKMSACIHRVPHVAVDLENSPCDDTRTYCSLVDHVAVCIEHTTDKG